MALDDKARGQRIAQLRKRRRLTQQAMAEQLRIGYRTYQTWEGGTMPEWPNLEKLSAFFGVKPEYLIGDDGIADDPAVLPQLDRIEAKVDQLLEAAAMLSRLDERLRLLEAQALADAAVELARSEASPIATARPPQQRQR